MRALIGRLGHIPGERRIVRRRQFQSSCNLERALIRGLQAGIFTYKALIVYVTGRCRNCALCEILSFQIRTESVNGKLAGLRAYGGGDDVAGNLKGLVFQIFMNLNNWFPFFYLFTLSNFQISLTYSSIVRSDEKYPDFAILTRHILDHLERSRYNSSTFA